MNEVKISVIVPIYNKENYLNKCLDSIVNQSYKNLEILLINDGSTDTSGNIIDQYAAKDKRIVAIHKSNGGIGSAYRIAFEKVTGDYISFVDSDDYINLAMYEKLKEIILLKNPDIIHFGMDFFNNKGEIFQLFDTSDQIIEGNDNILKYHFSFFKFPSLACRVFKRHLFNEVIFFDQNIGIDEMVIIQILLKCNLAAYIPRTLYYAFACEESVSRIKYSQKKIMEGIKVHRFICNYIEEHNTNYSQYLYVKYLNYLISVYDIARLDNEIRNSEELFSLMNDINIYYQKVKNTENFMTLHWELKLKIRSFIISPHLVVFLSSLILISKKLTKKFIPIKLLKLYRIKKNSI
ncbi:MAG TPA: glycosyltransferase [Hanamia sp.]